MTDFVRSAWAPGVCIAPALILVLARARLPIVVGLVGGAGLVGLVLWARARLLQAPIPPLHAVFLSVLGACAAAGAIFLGGPGATLAPDLETQCRQVAFGLAALASLAFMGAGLGSRLSTPLAQETPASSALEPGVPASRAGAVAILVLGGLFHGAFLYLLPPILSIDSWCNLWEPHLFTFAGLPHHPPLYVELVRLVTYVAVVPGLTALVLLQHASAIVSALLCEHAVRRMTGSAVAAVVAGLAVALDGMLALYSQQVMTESLSVFFTVASLACLVESEHREEPGRWLVSAGVACALGTLTRQVVQGWFLVILGWLLSTTHFRPRHRAALLFTVGALLPLGGVLLHNHVFYGQAALTRALGRSLTHRIVEGFPPPHDPDALPGDQLETARRLVWESRQNLWLGAHRAIRETLGWDDDRIGQAMVALYFEQVRKYPAIHARVTLEHFVGLTRGHEAGEDVHLSHNRFRQGAPAEWAAVPAAEPLPESVLAVSRLAFTTWLPILGLAFLAPLVTRGQARRLSVLALLSASYFILIPALVEVLISRYRLLATPCFAMAAALGAHGLLTWAQARRDGT